MLSFKSQVGKVKTGQTTDGFTIISPKIYKYLDMVLKQNKTK